MDASNGSNCVRISYRHRMYCIVSYYVWFCILSYYHSVLSITATIRGGRRSNHASSYDPFCRITRTVASYSVQQHVPQSTQSIVPRFESIGQCRYKQYSYYYQIKAHNGCVCLWSLRNPLQRTKSVRPVRCVATTLNTTTIRIVLVWFGLDRTGLYCCCGDNELNYTVQIQCVCGASKFASFNVTTMVH